MLTMNSNYFCSICCPQLRISGKQQAGARPRAFPCLPIFPAAASLSLVHSSALLNGWISCLSLVQLFFCSSINVTLGAHNIQTQERTQQHIPVLRAIPHPDYDPDNFLNDIMLLQVQITRPLALQPCWLPHGSVTFLCSGTVEKEVGTGFRCGSEDRESPSVCVWGMPTELECLHSS